MVCFADGPTTDVTLEIAAPAAELWPLVTDISLPVPLSDELQQVEWIDGHVQAGPGARFRGHNQRGDMRWSTESTVTAFEPPSRFEWTVGDPDAAIASWGFALTEVESGRTRLRQWCRLGPGRSGLTWAIKQNPDAEEAIIAARLQQMQASMRQNLTAIAERVGAPVDADPS